MKHTGYVKDEFRVYEWFFSWFDDFVVCGNMFIGEDIEV